MTKTEASGCSVAAPDLLKVALATCAIEHFNPRGKPALPDRSWSLGPSTPLYRAMLAIAYELQNRDFEEDDNKYALVRLLAVQFRPKPNEDFMGVARRNLGVLAESESAPIFLANSTLNLGVPYYTVCSKESLESFCDMLISAYGKELEDFIFEIRSRFGRMVYEPRESKLLLAQWSDVARVA